MAVSIQSTPISIPLSSSAQKKNINVWTIYYPDAGHAGRRFFRVFNPNRISAVFRRKPAPNRTISAPAFPVTLKPYFDEIEGHLENQYLLLVRRATGGKKGKFERIRVITEIPNVEFMYPRRSFSLRQRISSSAWRLLQPFLNAKQARIPWSALVSLRNRFPAAR